MILISNSPKMDMSGLAKNNLEKACVCENLFVYLQSNN